MLPTMDSWLAAGTLGLAKMSARWRLSSERSVTLVTR
jgi:hypothetical protein